MRVSIFLIGLVMFPGRTSHRPPSPCISHLYMRHNGLGRVGSFRFWGFGAV